tara:strand:+ start:1060 stop:1476 length:417 start_codon:yes stop_codon:yes gene_type:complete
MPYDPEGTLYRVQRGVIRAGISINPPWTDFSNGKAEGVEPQLLNKFAKQFNARIEWTVDSESNLFRGLKHRQLDVIIGGITNSTPWSKQAALTRPYLTFGSEEHVIAVSQGENRWLLEFDRFLQSHGMDAMRYFEEEK